MSLIYIGDKHDDVRNKLYHDALIKHANFDYKLFSWFDMINPGSVELIKKFNHENNFLRIASPWYEEKLKPILKNSSRNMTDKYYYYLLDKIDENFSETIKIKSPESIKNMRDKKITEEILKDDCIPTPESYKMKSYGCLETIIDSPQTIELIMKPKTGSMGSGIGLINLNNGNLNFETNYNSDNFSTYNDEKAKQKIEEIMKTETEFIFQQYINLPIIDNKKFDVRMLYIMDDIEFIYARMAEQSSICTNISKGATDSVKVLNKIPKTKLKEAEELARSATNSFNTKIAGVDIIFDKEFNPYVLEMNAFPGVIGPLKNNFNPYEVEIEKLNEILK